MLMPDFGTETVAPGTERAADRGADGKVSGAVGFMILGKLTLPYVLTLPYPYLTVPLQSLFHSPPFQIVGA